MPIRRFQGDGQAELSFKARTLVLLADTAQKVLLVQAAQTFRAVSQSYDSHNGLSRGPTVHVGENRDGITVKKHVSHSRTQLSVAAFSIALLLR
jgi:hypothetical protein